MPPTPEGEARCLEWLNYVSGTVHGGSFAQVFRPERFVADEKDFAAVEAKGRAKLKDQFAYMDSLLGDGRDWAVAGHNSIADSYLIAVYRWGGRIGMAMKDYAACTRHAERMMARPAVARTFQLEGITLG